MKVQTTVKEASKLFRVPFSVFENKKTNTKLTRFFEVPILSRLISCRIDGRAVLPSTLHSYVDLVVGVSFPFHVPNKDKKTI